jgi:two-component system OmpR family sensor kinase
MGSIKRQLLFGLLGLVLAAVGLGAWAVYRQARAELDELFDYQLRQMALSLRDQAFGEAAMPTPAPEDFDFAIQVWSHDGVRLYLSRPQAVLPARARLGYDTVETDEGAWRVFSHEQRGLVFQVAQPLRVREHFAAAAALRMIAPVLLLLPALGLLVWLTVGRGLRPLEAVAAEVEERTPSALSPVADRNLPREVRPLVGALNDLLLRLGSALEAQRRFVADAAHELRTPLTALNLQVQLAERAAAGEERAATLAAVKDGIARATRVVEQLLTLARQEPEAAARPATDTDLADLAHQVIAELMPLAERRAIDLGMGRAEPARVMGDREGLRALLANLVDNAVRYTQERGRVDVSTFMADGEAVIEVTDNGPGIPAEERERVFDRFYRRAGSGASGSGLGLAIVKAIAARHGGRIVLADAPGGQGLSARITLPPGAVAPTVSISLPA